MKKLLPFGALFLFVLTSGAFATEVLFLGNSFTHGHDARLSKHGGLPAVFEAVATGKGKEISCTMVAPSGKDWGFHLKNPGTLSAIESKTWDVVVLQDYSTKPTHIGDRKKFFKDGQALCDLIWKSSPDAKVVLYRTWARQPGNGMYGKDGKPGVFTGFAQMDKELGQGYSELLEKLSKANPGKTILLAPVGDAFACCVEKFPETQIYASDLYHAGVDGSYLASLVFLKTICGESPDGAIREFPTFTVEEEVAGRLKEIAAQISK